MTPERATIFMRRHLYDLERRMRGRVTFYRDSEVLNTKTGKKTTTKQTWQNVTVIVLPTDLKTKFVFDLSYIAANKNFTYGGNFDTSKKRLILRTKSAGTYVPQNQDYFIFDGKRWDLTEVQTYEYGVGFLLTGTEVKGSPLEQSISQSVLQYSIFTDSAVEEFGS